MMERYGRIVILFAIVHCYPQQAAATCDAVQACFVRNLATGVETDVTTASATYPIDPNNKVGYSMRCTLSTNKSNYVKFNYNGQSYDAYTEPRWMSFYGAGPPEYIAPVDYLATCGSGAATATATKRVTVSGHTWEQTCFTKTLTLTAQCQPVPAVPAPVPAPTPTAVAVTPAGSTSTCDALQTCYLRHLGSGVDVDLSSTKTYKIDPNNKLGYSIQCVLQKKGEINVLKFEFDNQVYESYSEPRWMSSYGSGSAGDYVAPVPYLVTCASGSTTKTVQMQGHTWTQKCFDKVYTLTAQCSSSGSSTLPPKAAPVPVPSVPNPKPVAPPPKPVPALAKPVAPTPVMMTPASLPACGDAAIQSCVVRNLASGKDVKVAMVGSTIASVSYDLDPNNKMGYSMMCTMQGLTEMNIIKYVFESTTFEAFAAPYWMSYYGKGSGAGSEYVKAVPYLSTSCGSKKIKVQGHTWSNQCFETVVALTAQCGSKGAVAPTSRQAPVPAPPAPTPVNVPPVPTSPTLCPAGFKLLSETCVKDWCEADFVCPSGAVRVPNRDCYVGVDDCECVHDHVKRLGNRKRCVKRRRVSFRQCRFGRRWWGACRARSDKALQESGTSDAQ